MKSLVPLGYAGETHELMVKLSPGRFELQERLGPTPRGVPCGIPNDGNHWIVMNEFEANS